MENNFRYLAKQAFKEGVKAANPETCLLNAVKKHPFPVPNGGKFIIISIGKAAISLMQTTLGILPKNYPKIALAMTNYENFKSIKECEVIAAGHPIPDNNGLKGTKKITTILKNAKQNDSVIILISGGSSALLTAPVPELDLNDKIEINKLLLSVDLNITDMNLIRQSMSQVKGGGLSSIVKSNNVISYILSDVIGDDLRVVGSGPTSKQIGNRKQAYELLIEKNLYQNLSPKLKFFFQSNIVKDTNIKTKFDNLNKNILIGNNRKSVEMMAKAAKAETIEYPIIENIKTAVDIIFKEIISRKKSKKIALAFGGETTVEITGSGIGGRNQELALRFAQKMYKEKINGDWCFLSGGTDGKDGMTNSTGAIVDQDTVLKLMEKNYSINDCLHRNDSNTALKLTKDAFSVGPTGTNVADLKLFIGNIC